MRTDRKSSSKDRKPCPKCGKKSRFSVIDEYHYTESGLENVYLQNVQTLSCECGESVVLTALPSLLRIIAMCFAYKPASLNGREIRFIRHVLRRKALNFAQALSITPEYLSRVENEAAIPGSSLDKLIRTRLLLGLFQAYPEMTEMFDVKEFESVLDRDLPVSDGTLGLYVEYVGPHVKDHEQIEFEFKQAA